MFSISQLAKKFGLSRTTLLYYEKEGLLAPQNRSANGYRWYGPAEVKRLEMITAYRSYGVPVVKIAQMLASEETHSQKQILQDQFKALEDQIQKLRQQQRAIIQSLKEENTNTDSPMNKDRWTEIMQASGFSDEDMINWHIQFEKMEPEEHQKFLETLNISETEIRTIRNFSKT